MEEPKVSDRTLIPLRCEKWGTVMIFFSIIIINKVSLKPMIPCIWTTAVPRNEHDLFCLSPLCSFCLGRLDVFFPAFCEGDRTFPLELGRAFLHSKHYLTLAKHTNRFPPKFLWKYSNPDGALVAITVYPIWFQAGPKCTLVQRGQSL